MTSIILFVLSVVLAPLFCGIIFKVKAFFGSKKGYPLLINYYNLFKLFKKGSVYSDSTTFLFRTAPILGLAVMVTVFMFFPFVGEKGLFSFHGDLIFIAYMMGLAKFFTIIAAMDTGSSFEGMGAAREAFFGIMAELTLFMIFVFMARTTSSLSMSKALSFSANTDLWHLFGPSVLLVIIALFMLLLTENSRIPVDDPETHLELTMIHEVMVLDHSGPELGLIHLAANLKLMLYSSFIARFVIPVSTGNMILDIILFYLITGIVFVFIGVIESIIARFKFTRVPKYIMTSFALVFFANIIILGGVL